MIKKLKPRSEFSRNVLTLMTGTIVAQAIPIAISPILTRLYTPEDFGTFALYMSLSSILTVIATGRYELAIMLPTKDSDAIHIMILSALITGGISILCLLIVFFFNTDITNLLGNESISNWLYLLPFSIFISGLYTNLNYWNNRKKAFKRLALNRVWQSGTTATANLAMGWSNLHNGLILGSFFGQFAALGILMKKTWKDIKTDLQILHKLKIISVAKRYIKFPKYDILASLSNILAQQLPNIFFNALFNAATAGFYYLTQKMLGLPITLIASSILDVFKEQASKDFKKYGNTKTIYLSTFKKLFLFSSVPSILIFFFAPDLFEIVFGKKWVIAGEYAQILAPMLFLRFISSPLSFMLYIGEKQHINLYSQLGLLIMILFSFFISEDPKNTVILISLSFSIFYCIQISISAKIAGILKRQHNILER